MDAVQPVQLGRGAGRSGLQLGINGAAAALAACTCQAIDINRKPVPAGAAAAAAAYALRNEISSGCGRGPVARHLMRQTCAQTPRLGRCCLARLVGKLLLLL